VADIETVRRLALALPEVEEGTWFRTPAWRLAAIEDDELAEVLEDSWRRKAPKRLIAERDA
jgi:hypothetical protein